MNYSLGRWGGGIISFLPYQSDFEILMLDYVGNSRYKKNHFGGGCGASQ